MPRLPVILATEGVEVAPRPRVPPNIAGPGLQVAGAQLIGAVDDYTRLEAAKKKVAVDQEAALLHADAELQLGARDADLRLTERDPDAYRQQYGELVREVTQNVQKQAKYPESVAVLNAKLAPTLARHQVEAFKHSNSLYVDRGVAQLDATLDSRRALAGAAVDDQDFHDQYKQGEAAIAAAAPLIGLNKAGDALRKFRQDTLEARALKEAHADPEGFAETADRRYGPGGLDPRGLDTKTREQLVQGARVRAKENQNEAERLQDKLDTKMEKITEKERQTRLTSMSIAAADRQLSRQQVIDARDRGDLVNPTEVEHFLTLATKQNTAESDPAIWSAVQSDVWSSRPAYTETRIRALMARHADGGAGLNGEHGRMALSELGRKRDHDITEGRTVENQVYARKNEGYHNAKEEGLRALGITTPMSQLDKKEAKLASDFEREYNARVRDKDGNVRTDIAPREEMLLVLPTFMNRQSAETRLAYEDQAGIVGDLVGSQVPDIMDPKFIAWYGQQQKATEDLAGDPKTLGLYKLRREQLQRLARTRNEYLLAEARKAASALGGGKSTGGYSAPGEK